MAGGSVFKMGQEVVAIFENLISYRHDLTIVQEPEAIYRLLFNIFLTELSENVIKMYILKEKKNLLIF